MGFFRDAKTASQMAFEGMHGVASKVTSKVTEKTSKVTDELSKHWTNFKDTIDQRQFEEEQKEFFDWTQKLDDVYTRWDEAVQEGKENNPDVILKTAEDIAEADMENPNIPIGSKSEIKSLIRNVKKVEKHFKNREEKIKDQIIKLTKLEEKDKLTVEDKEKLSELYDKLADVSLKKDYVSIDKDNLKQKKRDYYPSLVNRAAAFSTKQMNNVKNLLHNGIDTMKNFITNRREVGISAYSIANSRIMANEIKHKLDTIRAQEEYVKENNEVARRSANKKINFFNIVYSAKSILHAGENDVINAQKAAEKVKQLEEKINGIDNQTVQVINSMNKNLEHLKEMIKEETQYMTVTSMRSNVAIEVNSPDNYLNPTFCDKNGKFDERRVDNYEKKLRTQQALIVRKLSNTWNIDDLRPYSEYAHFKEAYNNKEFSADQCKAFRLAYEQGIDIKDAGIMNKELHPENMNIVIMAKKYDITIPGFETIEDIIKSQKERPAHTIDEVQSNPVLIAFNKEVEKMLENNQKLSQHLGIEAIADIEKLSTERKNIVNSVVQQNELMKKTLDLSEAVNEIKENADRTEMNKDAEKIERKNIAAVMSNPENIANIKNPSENVQYTALLAADNKGINIQELVDKYPNSFSELVIMNYNEDLDDIEINGKQTEHETGKDNDFDINELGDEFADMELIDDDIEIDDDDGER